MNGRDPDSNTILQHVGMFKEVVSVFTKVFILTSPAHSIVVEMDREVFVQHLPEHKKLETTIVVRSQNRSKRRDVD